MRKEDCFQLGHISRLHGTQGDLVAVFDTDVPERYLELESVFVDTHGELVPFFIDKLDRNSKGHFILHFEDVSSEEADAFIDRELWLPLNLLPPLTGKNFYFHEVMGFSVVDQKAGEVGECVEVIDSSAQPIFKVLRGETEFLIPAVDDFIIEIDRKNKVIKVDCPEGLLDLFQ